MGHARAIRDWTKFRSREGLYHATKRQRSRGNVPRQFVDYFDMQKGDVVVCKQGGKSRILGIGFVKSSKRLRVKDYYDEGYPHGREVWWLKEFPSFDYPRNSPYYSEFSSAQDTIHRITRDNVKRAIIKKMVGFLQLKPNLQGSIPGVESTETMGGELEDPYVDLPISDKEGRTLCLQYLSRERSHRLVKAKKAGFLRTHKRLFCEICGFDFNSLYGKRGANFIECHLRKPLSEFKRERRTKLEDLCLLCSNCHRMIHHKRPWDSLERLKDRVGRKRVRISEMSQQQVRLRVADAYLRVADAYTTDVGHGSARIDHGTMDALDASAGDVIEIKGKKRTVARCFPLYREESSGGEVPGGIVRIDGLIRNSAGAAIGDVVAIRKVKALSAKKVIVDPLHWSPPVSKGYLTKALEKVPVTKGDYIMVPYREGRLGFQVVDVSPVADAALVKPTTVFVISKKGDAYCHLPHCPIGHGLMTPQFDSATGAPPTRTDGPTPPGVIMWSLVFHFKCAKCAARADPPDPFLWPPFIATVTHKVPSADLASSVAAPPSTEYPKASSMDWLP